LFRVGDRLAASKCAACRAPAAAVLVGRALAIFDSSGILFFRASFSAGSAGMAIGF
jgi:hypothetical protein